MNWDWSNSIKQYYSLNVTPQLLCKKAQQRPKYVARSPISSYLGHLPVTDEMGFGDLRSADNTFRVLLSKRFRLLAPSLDSKVSDLAD
jgi:hypothetical protein